MAAPTIVTLAKSQKAAADQLQYGLPGWTYSDEETNGALSITVAAVANVQHYLTGILLSFAAAPASACTLTITDGSTVLFTVQIGTTAPTVIPLTFQRPIPAAVGAALKGDLSTPGNVKANLCLIGFSSPDQGTYA